MLQTNYPIYWLLMCLLVGAGYAYLLYSKKSFPWSPTWNKVLTVLRFLSVSLLTFLFLEPFIQDREETYINQEVVFLWDNSQSIQLAVDSTAVRQIWNELHQASEQLASEKEVQLSWKNLNNASIETLNNQSSNTPIHSALQTLKEQNKQGYLKEVVLISDGLYNRGPAPDYYSYPFAITTVAVGDTAIKNDVAIQQLNYNKVAYQGNMFPIKVVVQKRGYGNINTTVRLTNKANKAQTSTQEVRFTEQEHIKELTFLVEAKKKGFQAYQLQLASPAEEFNQQNNEQTAYVNIIEGQKKILLLADAPHPDINAIHAALKGNQNYELSIAIPEISPYQAGNYDVVILFHLPNEANLYQQEINTFKKRNTPIWFFGGATPSAVNSFNQLNDGVNLSRSTEVDEANVYLNNDFSRFTFEAAAAAFIAQLPPIDMPFEAAKVNPRADVLFKKQIGTLSTQQPIHTFLELPTSKQSTLLLEGFWKWRIYEYMQTDKFSFFDSWITQTLRWLTTVDQKNQFTVYPIAERFQNYEEVQVRVESYNEVFEPIAGNEVELVVSNADTTFQYDFKTLSLDPNFSLGNLPEGSYSYKAATVIAGKSFTSKGQFLVEKINFEALNLKADFDVLSRVSEKNNGAYFTANEISSLTEYLLNKEYPQLIQSKTQKAPLSDQYWLYVLVLVLLTGEWFLRRYYGSY